MVYEVRGVLQRADAVRGAAVIVHEEIAGYMEAMTMEFTAATPGELAGLEPGDVLTFRLRVGERDSRIEQIRKVGHTDPPKPVVAADAPVAGAEVQDLGSCPPPLSKRHSRFSLRSDVSHDSRFGYCRWGNSFDR